MQGSGEDLQKILAGKWSWTGYFYLRCTTMAKGMGVFFILSQAPAAVTMAATAVSNRIKAWLPKYSFSNLHKKNIAAIRDF